MNRGHAAVRQPVLSGIGQNSVMLLDLVPEGQEQGELALDDYAEASGRLMGAVDAINDRYGKGVIRVASAGVQVRKREFEMRQQLRTPR